jgi:hypothetical protein
MGIEPNANMLGKTRILGEGGAKSGAPEAKLPAIDPALAALIEAWPTLPEAVRDGVVAMVKAVSDSARLAEASEET